MPIYKIKYCVMFKISPFQIYFLVVSIEIEIE